MEKNRQKTSVKIWQMAFVALTLGGTTSAQADLSNWHTANTAQGKVLHEKQCTTCHAKMYGGDGSKIYTHDGRQLSDRLELLQRVAACSAQTKAGWFPEEELDVAAFLNQQYYQFKK